MKQNILARGAEAIIYKIGSKVVKDRVPKGYRHPELDNKIRKRRTKAEAKLISKAASIIPVPKLLSDKKPQGRMIHMQYISGKRLSDYLDKLKNYQSICKQIGKNIALLHDAGLIHGDLTTSNMILSNKKTNPDLDSDNKRAKASSINSRSSGRERQFQPSQKIFFIDFGLGFHSDRIEDKAVDLHLIKQALEAKHSTIYEKAFKAVLEGYKISKNYKQTLTRLKKVESRGRYKAQY